MNGPAPSGDPGAPAPDGRAVPHLCVHNWLEYLHADPEGDDPVIRAMADVGIDVTREFPRSSSSVVSVAGIEVEIGCGASCPGSEVRPLTEVA